MFIMVKGEKRKKQREEIGLEQIQVHGPVSLLEIISEDPTNPNYVARIELDFGCADRSKDMPVIEVPISKENYESLKKQLRKSTVEDKHIYVLGYLGFYLYKGRKE